MNTTPKRLLIVAPHPDDETFGCGGAILRSIGEGAEAHWLIVTTMEGASGYSTQQISERESLIQTVADAYGFSTVRGLGFPTAGLDGLSLKPIIEAIGRVVSDVQPTDVYVPFRHDVHSDHRIVFDAVFAVTKWFRHPGIHRILCYETLSETDMCIEPSIAFNPNVFTNVSDQLEGKLEIIAMYAGEIASHPFPRSIESSRALAMLRGSQAGFPAAEAFQLVREIG